MINGDTQIIAHVGYPTTTFKSPMIYNPWFERRGINAAVVPLGVRREDFGRAFPEICRFTNFHGALITMPHKIAVIDLLDEVSTAVKVAGSCNAVRRADDGRLIGDMFDGEGFVRGVAHNGASLARQEAARRRLRRRGLGDRRVGGGCGGGRDRALRRRRRGDEGPRRPAQAELSASQGVARIERPERVRRRRQRDAARNLSGRSHAARRLAAHARRTYVAEVVMKHETTAFLAAAQAQGCRTQVGIDMLFEQIPAYLEFFGFPSGDAGGAERGRGGRILKITSREERR